MYNRHVEFNQNFTSQPKFLVDYTWNINDYVTLQNTNLTRLTCIRVISSPTSLT